MKPPRHRLPFAPLLLALLLTSTIPSANAHQCVNFRPGPARDGVFGFRLRRAYVDGASVDAVEWGESNAWPEQLEGPLLHEGLFPEEAPPYGEFEWSRMGVDDVVFVLRPS